MEKFKDRTLLLGIDPSFVNFGACIYNPADKSMNMKTGDMQSMVKWIQTQCKLKHCIAVVENPALNSTTFGMWGMLKKQIDGMMNYNKQRFNKVVKKVSIADVQSSFLIAMNYAQKVGENKAAAKQIITMLRHAGVPVIEIAPSARDKAFTKKSGKVVRREVKFLTMPTKTSQAQFKELTGFEKRSSEHARDAATLVHGRSMSWAINNIAIELARREKQPSRPATDNENYFILNSQT